MQAGIHRAQVIVNERFLVRNWDGAMINGFLPRWRRGRTCGAPSHFGSSALDTSENLIRAQTSGHSVDASHWPSRAAFNAVDQTKWTDG